jgi:multidrug efflux pump subunit AcrA (membrane-fusion protein)
MDIVRKKSTDSPTRRVAAVVGISLVLIASVYWFFKRSDGTYVVDGDVLLTDTVKRGELAVSVRGSGVLLPKDVRWLTTNVEGKVERLYAKAGAIVQQGDVIMQLSNPALVQQLEERQWELDELEAQTTALRVSLESEVLDREAAVINEKLNYERSLLTLNAQETLLKQGVNAVSQIDHETSKIEVAQNKERLALETKRLQKQKENAAAQLLANQARLNRMRKTLERTREQVESLHVKASIDAVIQSMTLEVGQQMSVGANLARLAKRDEFIAALRIPESRIQEVAVGQYVTIDTRTSQVEGRVQRIDPAVNNGVVLVDVELVGANPKEARPELTVEGVIEIVKIPDTLYVKRPMFAKSTGQSFIYRVDGNNHFASKQSVRFGQSSNTYIEIKHGLELGQEIIVSDVSSWQAHQQIRIN